MTRTITIEDEFARAKEIVAKKKMVARLTGCPEECIDVFVQGYFTIADVIDGDLNLELDWYRVTKIGHKWFTVHVPEEKKSFKVIGRRYGFRMSLPTFRIEADVLRANLRIRSRSI